MPLSFLHRLLELSSYSIVFKLSVIFIVHGRIPISSSVSIEVGIVGLLSIREGLGKDSPFCSRFIGKKCF